MHSRGVRMQIMRGVAQPILRFITPELQVYFINFTLAAAVCRYLREDAFLQFHQLIAPFIN
jgi:hypothetical protein